MCCKYDYNHVARIGRPKTLNSSIKNSRDIGFYIQEREPCDISLTGGQLLYTSDN